MDWFKPKFHDGHYGIIDNIIYGPFGVDSVPAYERVPYSGKIGFLEETPGPYGENGVTHETLEGTFMYQPVWPNIVPGASWAYPRACTFLTTEGGKTSLYGMFNHCGTSLGGFWWSPEFFAFLYIPETGTWETWKIVTNGNTWSTATPTVQAIYHWQYWDCYHHESDSAICGKNRWQYATNASVVNANLAGMDMHVPIDWNVYMSWMADVHWVPWVNGTQDGVICHSYSPSIVEDIPSLENVCSKIDAMVYMMLPGGFPIKHVASGDLVQKAAEKKRDITTNMISFVKDLKDIKSLRPKLSNLKSLQGLASEYLGVKYGVLPTIGDLKSIVSAFRKRRYGTDANGFTVYRASSSGIEVKDDIIFALDQHVKIAIADEDSEFDKLCEQFDNLGFLPSFENIWDLVPYSFVLDWFVNVGNLLGRLDTSLRILRYNIRYTTLSYRERAQGSSTGSASYPFSGYFALVKYHRWVTLITPLPTLSLSYMSNPLQHLLEGGALVTQRIRK